MRVTDATFRFNNVGRYIDWGSLNIVIGGDDAATGVHTKYLLPGEGIDPPPTFAIRSSDRKPNVCPEAPVSPPTPEDSDSRPEGAEGLARR